jgi:Na+/H+-translocating membrane pyrophosphatase
MTKNLSKFAVFVLAILTAELLHLFAHHFVVDNLKGFSVYQKVAILMAISVLLFYPAFEVIEKYVHAISEHYVKGSKAVTGNKFISILLGFIVALLLLFWGFSYVWFHKNPFMDFLKWLKHLF